MLVCYYGIWLLISLVVKMHFVLQNRLKDEGDGFRIAMGAFDQTRPPVSYTFI